MNDQMIVKTEPYNEGIKISAVGDVIISNASTLQCTIDKAVGDGATAITLDLSQVNYIDSFGIGVVVKTKSEVDKLQGRFKVIVSDTLQTLFEKCHLDDYVDLETSGLKNQTK